MPSVSTAPETLSALASELRERRISPVEIAEAMLGRIEEDSTNAFITVTGEIALAVAARAEAEIAVGEYRGPLHGIPIALKDLIFTEGVRTTMGSAFFADHVPDHGATVAAKLEESGAIVVGKANTHEFAYGPTGDRSFFGPVRNPHDLNRITGGSSSGSAAAVAANLCYGALGSDTGGSIRIPAALCGVVGMKPTFGRVSKYGVFPLAWTLDHVGPITRAVRDNALMLNAIAGFDPLDPYSVDHPAEDFTRDLEKSILGGAIGLPSNFYFEHVDPKVEARIREAAEFYRSLGAEVRTVEIPNMWETLQAQRVILAAEAYAVHEHRLNTDPDKFGEEARERLLDGERPKAHRYASARQRGLLAIREFDRALAEVDILLTPTVPIEATLLDERDTNIGGYEERIPSALTRLTGPTDLTGHPSLSVPCGTTAADLPVGLQLIGRRFDEATVYRYGHAYEIAASKTI